MADSPWNQTDPPVNPGASEQPNPDVFRLPDVHGRLLSPDELPVPGVHYVEFLGRDCAVVKRISYTENEWVRLEVERTEVYADRFSIKDIHLTEKGTYEETPLQVRYDNAAAYARWRYRGYLAGEVSSL